MRGGQEARKAFLNVNPFFSEAIVEQATEAEVAGEAEIEEASKGLDAGGDAPALEQTIETRHQSAGLFAETLLQFGSRGLQMFEHRLGRRKRQRMPHKCAGEE